MAAARLTVVQQHDADPHAHPKLLELAKVTQELASATHADMKLVKGWLDTAGMSNGSAEALKRIIQREDRTMELEEARMVVQAARRERRQRVLVALRYAQWRTFTGRLLVAAGAATTVGFGISAWTGHTPAQLISMLHLP